nr:hypothetical protein [Lachnospiraceae bacterium]
VNNFCNDKLIMIKYAKNIKKGTFLMNTDSFDLFFNIIELLAGLYILYQGINMKRTGKVENSGLISKNLDVENAPDPQGFIRFMFPIYMVCGFLFAAFGIGSIICSRMGIVNADISLAITMALLVVCILFAAATMKAQKKYLEK